MLIVHPASTCDVCLEPYSWTDVKSTPHVISCGHVFCYECLKNQSDHSTRATCPLCRKDFAMQRVRKLHVDRYTSGMPEDHEAVQINDLLQRVANVSSDDIPRDTALNVMTEVDGWLQTRDDIHAGLYRPLRRANRALCNLLIMREEAATLRQRLDVQRAKIDRYAILREEEMHKSLSVERNLLERIEANQRSYEQTLMEKEDQISHLKSDNTHIMAELAKYQRGSNPLPMPPQPLSSERLGTLAYPLGSMSYSSHYRVLESRRSHTPTSVVTRVFSEPPPRTDISGVMDSDRTTSADRRSDVSKTSIIIPGARAANKVVPSNLHELFAGDSPSPDPVKIFRNPYGRPEHVPIAALDHTPDQSSVRRLSTPQYAYVPGVGYVPRETYSVSSHISDEDTNGQMTSHGRAAPHSSREGDHYSLRSDGPFAQAISTSSAMLDTAWSHDDVHATSMSGPSSVPVATRATMSDRTNITSTPSSSSIGMHNIGFGEGASDPSLSVGRRNTSSPNSIRSMISWETRSSLNVPPRGSDALHDPDSSRRSSMADLRLNRLPDISTREGSPVPNAIFSDSIPVPDTPRALPGLNMRSGGAVPAGSSAIRPPQDDYRIERNNEHGDHLTPRVSQASFESTSLGLLLSNGDSTRHLISDGVDLHRVNQSLMHHTDTESTRSRRRHSVHVSISDTEDASGPDLRASINLSVRADRPQYDSYDQSSRSRRVSFHSSHAASSQAPHTDRISGPLYLPSTTERNESHSDHNRQRRHSLLTTAPSTGIPSYPSSFANNDSFDVHNRQPRGVNRDVTHPDHVFSMDRSVPETQSSTYSERGPIYDSSEAFLSSGSLGLSLDGSEPGGSSATTASGEPTTIRAPRPVNHSRRNSVLDGWYSRDSR